MIPVQSRCPRCGAATRPLRLWLAALVMMAAFAACDGGAPEPGGSPGIAADGTSRSQAIDGLLQERIRELADTEGLERLQAITLLWMDAAAAGAPDAALAALEALLDDPHPDTARLAHDAVADLRALRGEPPPPESVPPAEPAAARAVPSGRGEVLPTAEPVAETQDEAQPPPAGADGAQEAARRGALRRLAARYRYAADSRAQVEVLSDVGLYRDPAAAELLLEAIADAAPDNQLQAVQGLWRMLGDGLDADRNVVQALERAATSPHPRVAEAAREALSDWERAERERSALAMHPPPPPPQVPSEEDMRGVLADANTLMAGSGAAGQPEPDWHALAERTLYQPDDAVRAEGLEEVALHRSAAAVEILMEAAAYDPAAELRLQAVQTLAYAVADGLDADGRAMATLTNATYDRDPRVARKARQALAVLEAGRTWATDPAPTGAGQQPAPDAHQEDYPPFQAPGRD